MALRSGRVLSSWGAFSLLELMTVVGILMTLAALAIPGLRRAQLASELTEVPVNLDALFTLEWGYYMDSGSFVTKEGPYPSLPLTRYARPFPDGTRFETELGWRPDGDVRAVYKETTACCTDHDNLYLYAWTDLDGDGIAAEYQATIRTLAPVIRNRAARRTGPEVY